MDPIRVLVVDDSAVMRGIMTRVINSQPDMTVAAVAADPLVAMERLHSARPDVMTLDVEMPRMDGLQFLGKLMQWRPMPVVMVSTLTARGADTTLRALELGAVDFVAKPQLTTEQDYVDYAAEIGDKLRAASSARVLRRPFRAQPRELGRAPLRRASELTSGDRLVVIGSSTGGVEALREVLTPLPAEMPPILIAQHMPAGFTRSFAQRLDALCALDVKEAEDGEPLRRGHAYIAPGGVHLAVGGRPGNLKAQLTLEPPVNRHRPSVDTLFRSAAQAAGERCIGVMLSGMGADGAEAMLELRRRGAHNIAQDEASCVVFGMPKQAIALDAVHDVMALRDIPRRLAELSQ
jgi:two-component system chemotaxis response regulator CheB